ncbi:hypothetical protein KEM56_006045 [Ascosphaera pollenicola]|nr:hypothetical protein KEM56_006045 [Ascosphaera pollenicola]
MARPRAAPKQVQASSAPKQENIPPATRQQRTSTRIPAAKTAAAAAAAAKKAATKIEAAANTEDAAEPLAPAKATMRKTRAPISASQDNAKAESKNTAEPAPKRGRPKGSTAAAKRKAEAIASEKESENGVGDEKPIEKKKRQNAGGDSSADELNYSPPPAKKTKKKQQQEQEQSSPDDKSSTTRKSRAARRVAANAQKPAFVTKDDEMEDSDEEKNDQSDEGLQDVEATDPDKQDKDEAIDILDEVAKLQETFPPSQKPGTSLASLTLGIKDSTLRRKISDLYKNYESMEAQYRQLRDVGIVEGRSLVEQMSEQCKATLTASKKLVENMQKELDAARSVSRKTHSLEKQLNESNSKLADLTKSRDAIAADLAGAESEKKKLKAKLEAARSAPAAVENMKIPNNTMKNNRGLAAAGAEAAKTAKLVQLKEDLYSDLSGLIILDVKVDTSDNVYDCIQTGLHATLHFKLWIPHDDDGKMASHNSATIRYTPLLENAVDRQALRILPDYLTTEITFARTEAPKFYRRVIRTLDQKIEDEEEEDEEEEEEDDEEDEDEEDDDDDDEE